MTIDDIQYIVMSGSIKLLSAVANDNETIPRGGKCSRATC